jgi:hypothetical protein
MIVQDKNCIRRVTRSFGRTTTSQYYGIQEQGTCEQRRMVQYRYTAQVNPPLRTMIGNLKELMDQRFWRINVGASYFKSAKFVNETSSGMANLKN